MGDVESGSSHEGGLPNDATETPTEGVTGGEVSTSAPLGKTQEPRTAKKPRTAKAESEDTSGRPDLTKVAQERAAGRNKRIKRTKEEE